MADDSGDNGGFNGGDSGDHNDDTNSFESNENNDKSTELVDSKEEASIDKNTELVEQNKNPEDNKNTELVEGKENEKNAPHEHRSIEGKILESPPKLVDEKYALRDEKGNIVRNRKGEALVDPKGYPPNDGFKESEEEIKEKGDYNIPKGAILSRYGSEAGVYFTNKGTPHSELSLPYKEETQEYREYEVIKELPCKRGTVAPAFGQKGGGVQYKTEESVSHLIREGYIRRVR